MKKIIKGGWVVFDYCIEKRDILIDGEKIEGILIPGEYDCQHDWEVIDAQGLYVMPGVIDPHCHIGLYKPFGSAIREDSRRQAMGGVTTVINYHRGNYDYMESVPLEIADGESNSLIDFAISLGYCRKDHIDKTEQYVKELGVTSFKFFFDKKNRADAFYGIDRNEAMRLDEKDFQNVLEKLKGLSGELLLCVHCEDIEHIKILEEEYRKSGKSGGLADFCATRPSVCEAVSVASAMTVNSFVGGNIYIVHLSAKKSLDVYRSLSNLGGQSTVETCTHYLTLTESSPCGLYAKVNPPPRRDEDIEALWQGIADGTVKTLGSDNVPVDLETKFANGRDPLSVKPGFTGAGMSLPMLISEGYHKRGIPLTTISRVCSTNAARAFCLDGKGEISVGRDADLCIVDPMLEKEITKELFGDSDFSVYEGMKLRGWPVCTVSRGEVIMKDGEIVAPAGRGKYIKRSVDLIK